MKSLPYLCLILLSTQLLTSCYDNQRTLPQVRWQVAFKHDVDGTPLAGSKTQLFAAIRAGKSVRIGWGWYHEERELSIEHLADPIWLAIVDEKEVIAHLEPQVLSAINWDTGIASYEDSTLLHQEWRVVINTDGSFDAVWYDRKANKVVRRAPQRQVMTWFVDELAPDNTKPLFRKN